MHLVTVLAALVAALANVTQAQQYAGDIIPNSLPVVPGSEITYFRINDPSGKNKNLTLTNYYSHGKNTAKRLVEANIQRAVIIIHGLNRDPGTYMSNMLSALAQAKSDPNVNFDTVAIMAPYFPNGDDKGTGYPWVDGLSSGKGSTSNALVWKASQWSAGGNNQYPSTSKNTSSYTVLDQIIQYFDNRTLFPKMQQIVVAGHSLGGQTVHRYAALGVNLNTKSPVSYWVGNPNSYVWLSTDRPLPISGCPDYDDYRDGYSAFADYPMTYGVGLVNAGRAAILANYNSKAVNYGRGTQDLGDDSTTCAPRTTGKDRNERFFNFIKAFPPSCSDPKGRNCDTVDFVNTGHDGGAMMASAAGQARLFLDNFYGDGNRSYDFGYPRQQAGDDPYPNPSLNATAASVNNNTYAGNMTYWGCWSDQSPQTLTNMTYQSNANTIDLCAQTCASGNNTIAGMEFGTQCFCGSSLGYRAQQVIESSCQNTCPGNSSQTCGGYSRLSIFSNGRPQLQPTPGTPENVGDFTYIACYTEASSGRALTGKGTSSNSMTLEFCANYCSGYQYFGTEYGSECYCGNSFAVGANRTNDDECNMLCANDPSEFCGAGNRLTVYQDADWVASSSASSSAGASATTSSGSSSGTGSQPTAVSCPVSNNTIVTSSGRNFTIECGIDHQGGDLTSLSVNGFQGCIDACAKNNKCVDVSLSGNACYLKSVLGAAVPNGGIWGAKVVDTSSSSSTTSLSTTSSSTGVVSISSTITSLSTTTSSSTGAPSTSSPTTASDPNTQTSSTPSLSTSTPTPSASNTPITCPASNDTTITSNGVSFLIECGIDHAGGDMKTLSVGSFQQCINACATTTGCVDLSMLGSACYLKSLVGGVVRNGVWGARVVKASTTGSGSVTPSSSVSSIAGSTTSSVSSGSGSVGLTSLLSSLTTSSGLSSSSSAAVSSGASSSATSASTSSTSSTTQSSATVSSSTPSASSPSSTSTTQSTSSTTTSPGSSASSSTTQSSSLSSSSLSSTISFSPTTLSTTTSPSQTSTSSAPPTLPTGFTALGCYTDTNTRLLPTTNGTSSTLTPQLCALACQTRGYKYSGTEYAQECWCGNTPPPASASAPSSQCSMRCTGDKTQTCGAGNRLSVVVDDAWKQTFFARQSYSTWNLLGCYVDSGASRTLAKAVSLAAYGGAGNATIANCLEACTAKGYGYCGGEYYSECYGSAAAPTAALAGGGGGGSGDVLSAGCSFPCKGNQTEACGGSNRIVVYVNNGRVG